MTPASLSTAQSALPALQEGEAQLFRTIADALSEQFAYFAGTDQECRFANQGYAQFHGHTVASIIGMTARQVLGEQVWRDVAPYVARALQGERMNYLRQHPQTDGPARMVDVTLTPHRNSHGEQTGMLVVARDVTHRWEAERAVRESDERMRKFADATEEAIVFHRNGAILDFNEAMVRLIGFTLEEARGTNIFHYIVPRDRPAALSYVRSGNEFLYEVALRHRDGHEVPVEVIGKTMPRGGADYRVVVARDIRTRKDRQVREAFLALHDPLTELPNRRSLMERLEAAVGSARRTGMPAAVLSINLDHFKTINESLGHAAGDTLLCETARRLCACVGARGAVARPEGDEFVAVVPALDRVGADALARELLAAVAHPIPMAGTALGLSVSIGVSVFPDDGNHAAALLRQAEAAQRLAKESGRGNHQFSAPGMTTPAMEVLRLETELRESVDNGELRLHYQPLMRLSDGALVGFEALVRWQHPTRGLLLPGAFIDFAESHGLITTIGRWVMREACQQLKRWHDGGAPQVSMSINLSALEFRQRDVARDIAAVLAETGLDARFLEIELTEGVLMQHSERLVETLRAIKALGVRIAIDDFGTGYSSLSYLKRYPLDTLKIDRSFVQDTPGSADDVAIVTAVVQLGRNLQLQTVAEGVEDESQRLLLQQLGCDLAQGYGLARPMTAEAAACWMQERAVGAHAPA